MSDQFSFDFESPISANDNPAIWTPRDIWARLNQTVLEYLGEDRRFERKGCKKINLDDLATYYSTFSNTPDGGLLIFGIDNDATIVGCNSLSGAQLNDIETTHLMRCPQAKPEFKRLPVIVNGAPDFCVAIYVPYIGRLVETNKEEAWIRYGESRHKMSMEEKQDFRSTRQELSFEQEPAPYKFPEDFDLRVIQDFCDEYRRVEGVKFTNEELLIDRRLLQKDDEKLTPLNGLVLLAAKDPGKSIPGCRVRIQRFAAEQEGQGTSYNPQRDRTVEGNVVSILRDCQAVIASMLYDVTWLDDQGKFVTTPEYPFHAWFETIVNAVVHRSYSFSGSEIFVKFFPDRMVVDSPGGFIPPVNEKTIYETRSARNHNLMDAMRHLGYVRMAREGARRIRESMKEFNLPEPKWEQEAVHGVVVRVTLRNDHASRKRATDTDVAHHFGVDTWKLLQEYEIKILAYAYRNKRIQVSEAARVTGRTWHTSKKDLDKLARNGLLIFHAGEYERDPKAHYTVQMSESGE
ncbi:ATP-binding protein [Nitrobacter sp. NHB1]|uniref:ATP-binding protein n=1 Tax=Nitrobacter sp. NHB1 TaxID=3119830 RepID=UPI002FFFA945